MCAMEGDAPKITAQLYFLAAFFGGGDATKSQPPDSTAKISASEMARRLNIGGSVEKGREPGDSTTGSITGIEALNVGGSVEKESCGGEGATASAAAWGARFPYLKAIAGTRPQSVRDVCRKETLIIISGEKTNGFYTGQASS
jgi:hypothetical protein